MGELELLASGYGLVEGPRVDADGNLYFSDVHGGGVRRLRPDGEIEIVVPKRRGVGGIALHADGGIVISGRDISHVRDGESRVVYSSDAPGFNDLFVDAAGRVICGSMRSDPFATEGQRATGEAWLLGLDGTATELYDDIALTNGIGFSPDGTVLYHADTTRGRLGPRLRRRRRVEPTTVRRRRGVHAGRSGRRRGRSRVGRRRLGVGRGPRRSLPMALRSTASTCRPRWSPACASAAPIAVTSTSSPVATPTPALGPSTAPGPPPPDARSPSLGSERVSGVGHG